MGKHIRADYVLGMLPRAGATLLDFLAHTLGLGVFAVIAYASWPNTVRAWRMGEWEGEGAIRLPVYPMRTILLVGSAVLALAFLVRAVRDVKALLGRPAAAVAPGLERPVTPP
jgi:TRAP-type C4-dicarboxylate transport system permease small subunit